MPRALALASLLAIALFTASTSAQVGSSLPRIEHDGLHGEGPVGLEDFAGRALLLFFFAPHDEAQAAAPVLRTARELDGAGLSVLGVTAADEADARTWLERAGFDGPWLRQASGDLAATLNRRTTPAVALVDLDGVVAWVGTPENLKVDIARRLLEGAVKRPLWDWPAEAAAVASALRAADYGKALAAARAMKTEDSDLKQTIYDAVGHRVTQQVNMLQRSLDAGDLLGVDERGNELAKALTGTPERVRVDRILEAAAAAPERDAVLKAQKQLAKLEGEIARAANERAIDLAIRKIRAAVKDVEGSFPARRAERLCAELESRRKKTG